MNEKIQVHDLAIDNYTAKDAMKLVLEYMDTEILNIVEMVTLSTLGMIQEQEELQRQMSEFDITFAGDKAILEAAGVLDGRRLQETEPVLFVKMVMRYLHKNAVPIFLIAEDEEALQRVNDIIAKEYSSIRIVGSTTIKQGLSNDMILNLMNGAEATCVLSTLPSPIQEQFIIRNKNLLNARVWFGFGVMLDKMSREDSFLFKMKRLFMFHLLKKQIADTKSNK